MATINTLNGITTITYPAALHARPGTYRDTHTVVMVIDGEDLPIKPPLRAFRTARAGESYELSGKELTWAINAAKSSKLKMDRFRMFCKEDGIPEDGRVIYEDGRVDIYSPDGMGYPTLVLRIDADGEVIDD